MSGSKAKGSDPGAWFVETNRVSLAALTHRHARMQRDNARSKSARVVIVLSLFIVLLGAGVLVGGHAAIDPIVQSAMSARESRDIGAVVMAMPDGKFCRHMSLNNATGEITESTIERCQSDIANERRTTARGFSWGAQ